MCGEKYKALASLLAACREQFGKDTLVSKISPGLPGHLPGATAIR